MGSAALYCHGGVKRGFTDARSDASVVPFPRSSWTGTPGIRALAAALALLVDGLRCAIPVSGRNHFDQLCGDSGHSGVLQGLSLPPLIRVGRVEEGRGFEEEEQLARKHAATAALIRLDQIGGGGLSEEWLMS